jgi:hypothetical protein
MDELNVHQFWGISPFIDFLTATSVATANDVLDVQQQQGTGGQPLCFLQVQGTQCSAINEVICWC